MQGFFFVLQVQIQKEGLCRALLQTQEPFAACTKSLFSLSKGSKFRASLSKGERQAHWKAFLGWEAPRRMGTHQAPTQRSIWTRYRDSGFQPLIDDRKSIKTPLWLSHKFQSYD